MSTYRPSPAVVAERFGNDAVVLHLPTSTYYQLDAVAALVFDRLQGGADAEKLCAAVAAVFDVETAAVQGDITALLHQLVELGLAEEA